MRTFITLLSLFMALLGRVGYADAPLQPVGSSSAPAGWQHGQHVSAATDAMALHNDAIPFGSSEEVSGQDTDASADAVALFFPVPYDWLATLSLPLLHAPPSGLLCRKPVRSNPFPIYLWNRVFRI